MNESKVAIRCGEHAFTRFQKLLPQQDRLLPKIYQTTDDQYIIYWDNIHWYESSDKRETELVRAFEREFDYLEERPFDQNGNILPGYGFEFLKVATDSNDYQYRSNDGDFQIAVKKTIHLPENLKELSPETGEELKKWVEKPVISKMDRAFLDYLNCNYKYIARDMSGELYVHFSKPHKIIHYWNSTDELSNGLKIFNIDFPMIQWSDSEPWLIEDLKKLEVAEEYE